MLRRRSEVFVICRKLMGCFFFGEEQEVAFQNFYSIEVGGIWFNRLKEIEE